ncbi:hypothetical protein COCOBI_10-2690 [Coccomyxa sp. Obi]|nr:hypothetical protein COCOBI_10-2690 [Coccomyxa sp. Obi]
MHVAGAHATVFEFIQVAWYFQKLSSNANRAHPTVRIRTTALDESSCREFAIAAAANSAPVITELPSSPKVCPQGPFSGSEVSFAVKLEAQSWLGLLNAVQEQLEIVLMVAPPALMELRIQGFDHHVQSMGLERLPRKVKYDLEPLPSSLTPFERLKEGLSAFFLEDPGIEPAPGSPVQQDSSDLVPQTAVHVGHDQPGAVPKPGSASWTACAGLVLSQDAQNIAPLGKSETERTGLQLLLFENYGYLHRPQDSILKAIERVNWIEYNLPLEGMLKQADGSVVLKFSSAADQISKEFQVLVVHLVSAADVSFKRPRKRTCPPGLSIQLEAKLVKSAVEDVLLSIKQSRPLTMMSPFEQRMACLSHISRSIAGIVSSSENAIFQDEALKMADSSLEDLPIKIQARLEEIALNVIAAAAEKVPAGLLLQ